MKNFKLELFNFKNELNIEQLDVARIAHMHLENCDKLSERELVKSLRESLSEYFYYNNVKLFVESLENELDEYSLTYELKDLYKQLDRKNLGMLYRQPMVTLLEIINKPDDQAKVMGILNELSIYDWIPEVKMFLMKMNSSPIEKQNLKNSGKASKVFTLVEKVEEGHLAFIIDRWFLISESSNDIKQVLADEYIKDTDKIRNIRLLEQVMQTSDINEEFISFRIDENLMISVSTKDSSIYLNEEKLDKETTLETLFNSPLIPYLKRNFYSLLETTLNNIDKFMDLDIAIKVGNLVNRFTENVAFNYKDKNYVYSRDSRYGSKFYAYENVTELIHDVQKELDYDLSHFYENKLSQEVKKLRTLTDKEKQINIKLKDISESLDMLNYNKELLEESAELQATKKELLLYQAKLMKELNDIRVEKTKARIDLA